MTKLDAPFLNAMSVQDSVILGDWASVISL